MTGFIWVPNDSGICNQRFQSIHDVCYSCLCLYLAANVWLSDYVNVIYEIMNIIMKK